jgi:hypothetical protein
MKALAFCPERRSEFLDPEPLLTCLFQRYQN